MTKFGTSLPIVASCVFPMIALALKHVEPRFFLLARGMVLRIDESPPRPQKQRRGEGGAPSLVRIDVRGVWRYPGSQKRDPGHPSVVDIGALIAGLLLRRCR